MAHAEDPVTSEPRPGSAVVDCPFRYVKLGRIDDWCPQHFPFHSPHSLLFCSSPDGRSNTISEPQVIQFYVFIFFSSLFLSPSLPLSLFLLSLSLTLPLSPLPLQHVTPSESLYAEIAHRTCPLTFTLPASTSSCTAVQRKISYLNS